MKVYKVTKGAAGLSAWIRLDELQSTQFNLGLWAIATHGAILTYSIYGSPDDPQANQRAVTWARSSTTVTITDTAHGLDSGDSVFIQNSVDTAPGTAEDPNLDTYTLGAGVSYVITYVDANTYTITTSGVVGTAGTAKVGSLRAIIYSALQDIVAGSTPRSSANLTFPVTAISLYISSYSSGSIDLIVDLLTGR